jgi:peptidoglycan/LPS O-acetylase OafA/YrhL
MSFLYIQYMLIGTLFNLHYRGSLSGRGLAWGCAAAFLVFVMTWANNHNLRGQEVHGALNYLLALLCFALFYANRRAITTPRILAWLGDISYPLYAVHPIVGYAVLMYLSARGMSPLPATLITLGVVLALATILHYAIEAPTNRLGKRVAAWSGRKLPRPIATVRP